MRHEIIKTDNYLLVLDYKDVQPGDSFLLDFDHPSGRIRRCYRVCDDGKEDLLMIDPVGFGFSYRRECKRISSHRPLNGAPYLSGVDVLPPNWRAGGEEDEVEELANEEYELQQKSFEDSTEMFPFNDSMLLKSGFISGYNKAREKYKFTEEHLRKAIKMGIQKHPYAFDGKETKYKYSEDEIIQSLQQPKYPIAFECEMITRVYDVYPQRTERKPKTIINSEGRVEWVGKYIYE
jgi:hypothetical protein